MIMHTLYKLYTHSIHTLYTLNTHSLVLFPLGAFLRTLFQEIVVLALVVSQLLPLPRRICVGR